jgi:hypothetical protein
MRFWDIAWTWNATDEEWRTAYPCDKYIHVPHRELMRAIDVDAPASETFRWICQVKVAPYSYDLIDNRFRRSPRQLTPGAERLAPGQRFLVYFHIVEFEADRHVTVVSDSDDGLLCGFVSMTYAAVPTGPATSRLVVKLDIECRTRWDPVRLLPLAWGDLIMMRKQLLTLKMLAEKTARAPTSSVRAKRRFQDETAPADTPDR